MNSDYLNFRNHVLYSAFCSVKNVRTAAERRPVSVIEGCKTQQHGISCTLCWPSLESRREYQICLQIVKCLDDLTLANSCMIFTIRAFSTLIIIMK